MHRILNSRIETQTIYEIYRACRLCGAGAGYKMPIIQNVVDLDGSEVELKQKIRECVQIEVHQDDKMPPLICELCVDKVNDFYEFYDLCRQTNKRTRMRLGLPMQTVRKKPDTGDCLLGVTETVYIDDTDGEPLSKHKDEKPHVNKDRENLSKNKNKYGESLKINNGGGITLSKLRNKTVEAHSKLKNKSKNLKAVKKESDIPIKIENQSHNQHNSFNTSIRSSRSRKQNHSALCSSHHSKSSDDMSRGSSLESKKSTIMPKSQLKKEKDIPIKTEERPQTPRLRSRKEEKDDGTSLLKPRPKRFREKDSKEEVPAKKVKMSVDTKQCPQSSPKGAKHPAKGAPPPASAVYCAICKIRNKTAQGHASHMRGHLVSFTNIKLACNACEEWFISHEAASAHHKKHKIKNIPYTCRRCTMDFKHQQVYDDHFVKKQCVPRKEVPDVKCEYCWRYFPTNYLMEQHKCPGEDGRPGGKCGKCKRVYALLKNLTKHQVTCTAKKKGDLNVDPDVLGKLKSMQIRVSRCDPLLTNIKQEHYDVSTVDTDYGLDRSCYYPYIASVSSIRIKTEPIIEEYDSMVSIKEEIKEEFCTEEDYVHWDSEDSTEEEVTSNLVLNPFAKKKKLETLSNLSLRTIFSQKFLGKVPRKKRKVKTEMDVFDSDLNTSQFDSSIGNDDFNKTADLKNANNSFIDSLIHKDIDKSDISVVNISHNDNFDDLPDQDSSEKDKNFNNGATDILQWSEMDEKIIDDSFDGSSDDSKQENEQNFNLNNKTYIGNNIVYNTDHLKDLLANDSTSLESGAASSENNDSKDCIDDQRNIDDVKVQTDIQKDAESKSIHVHGNSILNKINYDVEKFVEDSTENKTVKSMEEQAMVNRMDAENIVNKLLEINSTDVPAVSNRIEEQNQESNLLEIKSVDEGPTVNIIIEEGMLVNSVIQEDVIKNIKDVNSAINKIGKEEINHNIDGFNDNFLETVTAIDINNEMDLETRLLDDNSTNSKNMSMEVDLNNEVDEEALENRLLNENKEISNDNLVVVMNNKQILYVNDDQMIQHFKEDPTNVASQGTEVAVSILQSADKENEAVNNNSKQDIIKDSKNIHIDTKYDANQDNVCAANNAEVIQCITKNGDFNISNDSVILKNINNDSVINGVSQNNARFSLDDISDIEMEDRKLMEALDAQIGENNPSTGQNNDTDGQRNYVEYEKDKILLEDLLSKRDNNLRSMDLDSISDDDFNFDI